VKKNILFYLLLIALFVSCTSKKEEGVVVSDATLFGMAQTVSSFTYYKLNTDTLSAAPQSPHLFFVRVRFNPKAANAMNDSASALKEQAFPNESMIVKEVYSTKGGSLQRYEIMYKLKNAANNGSGWVWSELAPDGSPFVSSALKGSQCVSCHSDGNNSDLVRTFALH
jgi:hypothetical protein